jgi:hypothetical protein
MIDVDAPVRVDTDTTPLKHGDIVRSLHVLVLLTIRDVKICGGSEHVLGVECPTDLHVALQATMAAQDSQGSELGTKLLQALGEDRQLLLDLG